MAGQTRFERLHTPGRVELVEKIAMLTLDVEEKTGKPILYMTRWDIAQEIGVDEQLVSMALRLSYTAEFMQQYGYGFIPPGNGRSGAKYGYVLENDKSKAVATEIRDALSDTDMKLADHLRGSAQHWTFVQIAHGKNTKIGRAASEVAEILNGAAAGVEKTLREEG